VVKRATIDTSAACPLTRVKEFCAVMEVSWSVEKVCVAQMMTRVASCGAAAPTAQMKLSHEVSVCRWCGAPARGALRVRQARANPYAEGGGNGAVD